MIRYFIEIFESDELKSWVRLMIGACVFAVTASICLIVISMAVLKVDEMIDKITGYELVNHKSS